MNERDLKSNSPEETMQIGFRVGQAAGAGDVIALFGGLGAGKTVFTKGVLAGLGGNPNEAVSPTFTLMIRHDARLPLFHFDAYRLGNEREFLEIGGEETLTGEGVSVVEWSERVIAALPDDRLEAYLTVLSPEQRLLHFIATGERSQRLLQAAAARS